MLLKCLGSGKQMQLNNTSTRPATAQVANKPNPVAYWFETVVSLSLIHIQDKEIY